MTDETVQRYGSTGKMQVAAALLVAQDQGLIDLDDPVIAYEPDFALSGGDEAPRCRQQRRLTNLEGQPQLTCVGAQEERRQLQRAIEVGRVHLGPLEARALTHGGEGDARIL